MGDKKFSFFFSFPTLFAGVRISFAFIYVGYAFFKRKFTNKMGNNKWGSFSRGVKNLSVDNEARMKSNIIHLYFHFDEKMIQEVRAIIISIYSFENGKRAEFFHKNMEKKFKMVVSTFHRRILAYSMNLNFDSIFNITNIGKLKKNR